MTGKTAIVLVTPHFSLFNQEERKFSRSTTGAVFLALLNTSGLESFPPGLEKE
jgi:hypothetical protein